MNALKHSLLILLLAGFAPAALQAGDGDTPQPPPPQQHHKDGIHGTLTAASATSITITLRDGSTKDVSLTDTTKVTIDRKPATAADLADHIGERAFAHLDPDGKNALEVSVHKPKPKPAAAGPDGGQPPPGAGGTPGAHSDPPPPGGPAPQN